MKAWLAPVLFFGLLLGVWQILAATGFWSPIFMPAPLEVARFFVAGVRDRSLLEATGVTLKRLLLGYGAGLLLGLPLGLLTARSIMMEKTLGLLALGLQTLPSVCWAPLALIWFGQTESAMFFIVIMGSVWSILLATDAGVRNVPPIFLRAAQTMGSHGFHSWIHVIAPASLPFVVTGMKQGWAFAWRSLMAAEIYITILTGLGLGSLLHYGREVHAMEQVIGIMLLIIAIGLLTDRLVFSPVERYLHLRWGTGKN